MRKSAYLIVFLLFLASYWITSPDHLPGDTARFVGDAIGHARGLETQFWDFGHLLWRPWAYAGHWLLGNWYARAFGDTPVQAVTRFLIHTNFICSAGALMLLLFLLRKVARTWIAVAVVFAMNCSIPFLNSSHSGSAYIPAFLFSVLTLCLLTTAAECASGGRRYVVPAGIAFAIACALWFPFSISGLGMLLALYCWPSPGVDPNQERPRRLRLMGSFLLSLTASAVLLFAAGAAARGIGSVSQLSRWVLESDNGVSQSLTAMRAVTGLPRSVWSFGGDTILLKRWLFSDPYNPVHIWTVAFSLGAKLAAFYLGLGAALWVLWRERREILVVLVAAGIPMLLFAIALFEPSAPERFLPVIPFAYLAFAVVLDGSPRHAVASALIVLLLGSTVVFNLAQNGNSLGTRAAETRRRLQALDRSVQPGALVFVVTFNDDLYWLPLIKPLDDTLASSRFQVRDAVELASIRMRRWRAEFAERTQEQWARNKEVWISERLLAARPEARWQWVEGDNRTIRWPDLPETFGRYEFDSKVLPGGDGFLRLAQSQANRDRLARELRPATLEGESAN